MKSEDEIHKLSYMLITQAVAGDENALSEILSIYEPYAGDGDVLCAP